MSAAVIAGLDPAAYVPHPLHGEASVWPETNCSADLWIGVLHALGLDPVPLLSFGFEADFEGDQWTFVKPSLDDLWTLYGVEVQELNLWDGFASHVQAQVGRGHLPLVEVDSFYLPDSVGTAYMAEHTKTTIGVNVLDLAAGHMEYFHNSGYYALAGGDLRAVLRLDEAPGRPHLLPYAEFAKLLRVRHLPPDCLRREALPVARRHLNRRPVHNPLTAFRTSLAAGSAVPPADPVAHYHKEAFATVRQLGAAFQMAAANVRWLDADGALSDAATAFDGISASAKALLFKMARAANTGRPLQFEALVDTMEAGWQTGFDALAARL